LRLMKINNVLAAIAFSPFLFSCKKETTTETPASSFSYQLKTVNTTSALNRVATTGRTEAASVQWTAGTASANMIKFEAKNSTGEVEFKQSIQQQIDLFAANSILGAVTIPPGTYSEVEFKASLASNGNAKALVLNGVFSGGAATVPISFEVVSNVELKVEKANITVAASSNYSVLNAVDLSQLTRNISEASMANATRTNGTIVISANSNTGLYNTILANLNSHHGEAEVEHH
jgi:hypothetical protein